MTKSGKGVVVSSGIDLPSRKAFSAKSTLDMMRQTSDDEVESMDFGYS